MPTADPMKHYERRYTPSGNVAHLVHETEWSSFGGITHSACGWSGVQEYWRGTGSQEEYEKADALPICQKCLERVTN